MPTSIWAWWLAWNSVQGFRSWPRNPLPRWGTSTFLDGAVCAFVTVNRVENFSVWLWWKSSIFYLKTHVQSGKCTVPTHHPRDSCSAANWTLIYTCCGNWVLDSVNERVYSIDEEGKNGGTGSGNSRNSNFFHPNVSLPLLLALTLIISVGLSNCNCRLLVEPSIYIVTFLKRLSNAFKRFPDTFKFFLIPLFIRNVTICLFVYFSVHLSICLFICLSNCRSLVETSIYVYLFVGLFCLLVEQQIYDLLAMSLAYHNHDGFRFTKLSFPILDLSALSNVKHRFTKLLPSCFSRLNALQIIMIPWFPDQCLVRYVNRYRYREIDVRVW